MTLDLEQAATSTITPSASSWGDASESSLSSTEPTLIELPNQSWDPSLENMEQSLEGALVQAKIVEAQSLPPPTPPKIGGENWLDNFQSALDVGGLVPGIGEPLDGLNALIYLARGDYVNAGLSAAAMVPVAGMAAGGIKIVSKAVPPVHMGKQGKHIVGHNNYIEGRSILTADPEKLKLSAGMGEAVPNGIKRGEPGFKETVDFGEKIGYHVDKVTGVKTPTTEATIHYAKDNIHIVPLYPKSGYIK